MAIKKYTTPPPAPAGYNYAVDLKKLAKVDPEAAQTGYQLNQIDGQYNFDNRPDILRGDEFLAATAPLAPAAMADPQMIQPHMRLLNAFVQWRVDAHKTGKTSEIAPNERIFLRDVAKACAITIAPASDQAGTVTAHGAFSLDCLQKHGTQGKTTLALAYPAMTDTQKVDDEHAVIDIVDQHGQKIDNLLQKQEIVTIGERRELRLQLDLAKLPSLAFLRWSVPVTLQNAPEITAAHDIQMSKIPHVYTQASARFWPKETHPFLQVEPAIQHQHPEIRALAAKIRAQSPTLLALMRNTQAALEQIRAHANQSAPYHSDALGFLRTGNGQCESNSNLFAALMRANGVPTRVIAGIYRGMNQDMHRQNEIYTAKGWVRVEPQASDLALKTATMVSIGIPEVAVNHATEVLPQQIEIPSFARELDAFGRPQHTGLRIRYGLFSDNGPVPSLMAHGISE